MQFPPMLQGESLKRLLQGAFVGFFATVIIGFNWGGWTLESTAKQMAQNRANAALVAALAPMCEDKFRQAALRHHDVMRAPSTIGATGRASRATAGASSKETT